MSKIFKSSLAVAATIVALPVSAASVLTFDEGPYVPFVPYVEDGYVVDADGELFAADGSIHIDIYFGPNARTRTITREDGGAFDVHSLDIISLFPNVTLGGIIGDPKDDVRFDGFDATGMVATKSASSQVGDSKVEFGDMFKDITSLVITGFDAGNLDLSLLKDIHFLIDNMTVSLAGDDDDPVSSVPLPASGALLGMVLLAAGGIGSVSRRR